jgi:hypothetical protein
MNGEIIYIETSSRKDYSLKQLQNMIIFICCEREKIQDIHNQAQFSYIMGIIKGEIHEHI